MAYILIGFLLVGGICMFLAYKKFSTTTLSYSSVRKDRLLQNSNNHSSCKKSSHLRELTPNFDIAVHVAAKDKFVPRCEQTPQEIDGVNMIGVAEQVRRLGGKPKRYSTWEEAVIYMRSLAGIDDIPPVYNLTRKIDQRMYRKIKKLGGDPRPDWSYFESKIYISRLEKGITAPFCPVLLERYGADFTDWFYRKSDAWKEDVRELPQKASSTIRFEVGRKYVQTEYPPLSSPYIVECVANSSGKVRFRFPTWANDTDDERKIKVRSGVEVADGFRADYTIEERSMEEKEKLTHWVVDFGTMEKPKKTKSASKVSRLK